MTFATEPAIIPADDLEQRPHDVFRHHRPLAPLVRREDGVYMAIRAQDVETLATEQERDSWKQS